MSVVFSINAKDNNNALLDFLPIKIIGKGAFSTVIMVRHLTSGRLFAMKVINKKSINKKIYSQLLTERITLSKFNSNFIVKLHWAFQSKYHLHIIEEFCPGGELFFHMKRLG